MYRKLVSATYVINIIFQAFFTLLMPVGLCFLISWLLVSYASAPKWLYAPLLILGVLVGLFSMIKFIISAMSALEKLEAERISLAKEKQELDDRRSRLTEEMKTLEADLEAEDSNPIKANGQSDSEAEDSRPTKANGQSDSEAEDSRPTKANGHSDLGHSEATRENTEGV